MASRRVGLAVASALAMSLTAVVTSSPTGAALARPAAQGPASGRTPHPGAPGAGDRLFPHAGNGGYDVRHYRLFVHYVRRTRGIRATAGIRIRAHQDLSRFDLDLQGLHIDRLSVDGTPARFDRRGQELRITPAFALRPQTTHHVLVAYHGVPVTHIDPDGSKDGWIPSSDGVTVASEPVGAMTWFPDNDTPADKASYRIAINVPRGLTGVSNGILRQRRSTRGRTTWVWAEHAPMATYLATATIGRFTMIRGVGPHHLPVLSFVDPTVAHAVSVARMVPRVLRFESSIFGRYPFGAAGVIIDRNDFGYSLETQTRPVFPYRPGRLTLAHELAHQWYGDSVGLRRWSDIWLNEGFATYAEWLWRARTHPHAPHRQFARLLAEPAGNPLWRPPPARPGTAANLFGDPIYDRGAMTLQAVRQRVGTAAFLRLLPAWAAAHRHGHATTAGFVRFADTTTGAPLRHLLDVWLFSPGRPSRW